MGAVVGWAGVNESKMDVDVARRRECSQETSVRDTNELLAAPSSSPCSCSSLNLFSTFFIFFLFKISYLRLWFPFPFFVMAAHSHTLGARSSGHLNIENASHHFTFVYFDSIFFFGCRRRWQTFFEFCRASDPYLCHPTLFNIHLSFNFVWRLIDAWCLTRWKCVLLFVIPSHVSLFFLNYVCL